MLGSVPYSYPDGTINPVYWDYLFNFEATKLRKVYLDEMRRLCPDWVEMMEKSKLEQDFDIAITAMDEAGAKTNRNWLDSMDDENRRWSLATKFH